MPGGAWPLKLEGDACSIETVSLFESAVNPFLVDVKRSRSPIVGPKVVLPRTFRPRHSPLPVCENQKKEASPAGFARLPPEGVSSIPNVRPFLRAAETARILANPASQHLLLRIIRRNPSRRLVVGGCMIRSQIPTTSCRFGRHEDSPRTMRTTGRRVGNTEFLLEIRSCIC